MYSSLPVIVFVECVLGRRSVGAALSLSRNRMLYLKSDPLFPLPAQILLYLLPNWCMVGGLVVWYYDADAQQLFDSWELLVMWLVVLAGAGARAGAAAGAEARAGAAAAEAVA